MHAKKKKTDIKEEEDEQKYHVNFVLRFRTSFFLVFFFLLGWHASAVEHTVKLCAMPE